MASSLLEYSPELDELRQDEFKASLISSGQECFGEIEEMELATALLEVNNIAELDLVIKQLISRAGLITGSTVNQALGSVLKSAARKTLPMLRQAARNHQRRSPAAGAANRIVTAAGKYFAIELEGLSPEDQEFEAAKHFVRFAKQAARNAAAVAPDIASQTIARVAAIRAAQRYAPGLLAASPNRGPASHINDLPITGTGRWVRQGRHLIIDNC